MAVGASGAVATAIERLVAEAKARGGVLRTGDCGRRLASEHPDCGMSRKALGDAVARQAIAAGVAIQFTPAD